MKQIRFIIICFCTIFGSLSAIAQESEAYFTREEMPDMLKFLPPPPDTLSEAFSHDIMRYFWGKEMRNDSARAAIAIRDADCTTDNMCKEFSSVVYYGVTARDNTDECQEDVHAEMKDVERHLRRLLRI